MQSIILQLCETVLMLGIVFASVFTILECFRHFKERKRIKAELKLEERNGDSNGK